MFGLSQQHQILLILLKVCLNSSQNKISDNINASAVAIECGDPVVHYFSTASQK